MFNWLLGRRKPLADSRASITMISYKFFNMSSLGEPRITQMTPQLTDRSIRHPSEITEYVLVKAEKYILPVDFVVVDVDDDVEVPLILGRSFLPISKALIDMDGGEMTVRIGDENLTYRLIKEMRHSLDFDDTCYFLDITNSLIDDYV